MDRWGVYIDIEGFSAIYRRNKGRAIRALGDLMDALYKIGGSTFAKSHERLFVHQFGDGFVVVSDFPENTPERPLAICLAVMRHLIARGVATKAGIAAGDFGDFFHCYPSSIQAVAKDERYVALGEGLMTIIPVMGSALIESHEISSRRRGAVLLVDVIIFSGLPPGVIARSTSPTAIDWVHSDYPLVKGVCNLSALPYVDPATAEKHLRAYSKNQGENLPKDWIASTLESV
jgi:hypothetical protein